MPTLCVLLLAAVLWLLNHPHIGFLNSDAEIYALLALHWLDPAAYARDPFFMFGSQDDFSIFSPLYGSLIRLCGLSVAAQVAMVVAALLWTGAAWMLARHAFDDWRVRAYVVLSLAIYSFNYSPNHATFVLNENYATARVFAIPMAVMAMTFSLERKWMFAGAMALLSMTIHPLLGIWGVVLMVGVRLKDRVLLGLLVACAATIVGASLMPGPAAFHVMDAEWAEMVRQSTGDVFVGPYGVVRLNATLFWIAALLLGARFGSPRMQRWYQVTALMASYGFLMAQLCSYFYPLQLIMQAQPWRVMWLAIYFGIFALADVGRILLFGEQHLRVTAVIAAVMLFVFRDQSVAPLLAVWLLLRGSLSSTVATAWRKVFRSYGLYIKVLAVGLILVVAPTYCRELAIDGSSLIFDWLPDASMLKGLLIFGGLGLGPLLWCYVIARPPLRTVVVLLLLPALVAAAIHWDHRLGSTLRWEEMVSAKRQPWMQQSPVQKGDVVLWPGNSQRVLFELGTASYASSFQTTGVVLSQKKTNELSVRLKRMSIASLADTWPLTKGRQAELLRKFENAIDVQHGRGRDNLHAHEPAQLTNFGLRYLCEDPALDWVVSGDTPETPVVPAIHFRDSWQEGNLSLYDCKRFRAETTQRSSPMFTIAGG